MAIPLFATVVGGLVLGWRRRESVRRRRDSIQFLSTVSHELRTPLNAMIGWVNLLKTGRLGTADTARALEYIDRNLQLERRLVDDLLDAAQLLSGRTTIARAPVDLGRTVVAARDRVASLARQKSIRIAVTSSATPILVLGDETRLGEIVRHLLTNAVKFSSPESTVSVDVAVVGDCACIRVADEGEGIGSDDLTRVFEPLIQGRTRTRRTGLGLGLSIARQLVALHNGTISAYSAGEGCGSVFRVTLPLINSQSDSPGTTIR